MDRWPRQASLGHYANGQSAYIAKWWVRWSCHGLSRSLRQHFRTRFWRTFSETSPHLSVYFQAEPPIRERKNKVDPFGNECRLAAATCGLVHFDDNIQRSPAKLSDSHQDGRSQMFEKKGKCLGSIAL